MTKITINGVELDKGQMMTLHVALNSFLDEMQNPFALGRDPHGQTMTEHYAARSREMLELMNYRSPESYVSEIDPDNPPTPERIR